MCRLFPLNAAVYKTLPCLFAAFYIFSPTRHATHYGYVADSDVVAGLYLAHREVAPNLNLVEFERLVADSQLVPTDEIFELKNLHTVQIGGEFTSKKCLSNVTTALIVPYRNRPEQLKIFLNYMHYFIQKQCISYRIFIVDQLNSKPFNRAKMLNIGALEAIKLNFSCLILHDVDLLPITTGNLYTCSLLPRHMSSCLDIFRYQLTYPKLLGGVVSIRADQFKQINGMSNLFYGWGGEDDDFNARLLKFHYVPCRFSPKLSKYIMLKHSKQPPSKERFNMLKDSLDRQASDGLNSLSNNYLVEQKALYTHIKVIN